MNIDPYISKETAKKLRKCGSRGWTHDRTIDFLIDCCEKEKQKIKLTDETIKKLLKFVSRDADSAINILIERSGRLEKNIIK